MNGQVPVLPRLARCGARRCAGAVRAGALVVAVLSFALPPPAGAQGGGEFEPESHFIFWSPQRKLVRADFQGTVPASLPFGSLSYISIDVSWACDGDRPEARVTAQFDQTRSWWRGAMASTRMGWTSVRGSVGDGQLLDHEQTHFDLGELYARKIRARFAKDPDVCASEGRQRAHDEINRLNDEFNREQERYDRETGHGIDSSAQVRWASRVRRALSAGE